MKKTELTLKTLTPLWTGGIDTNVADRLPRTCVVDDGRLREVTALHKTLMTLL